MSSVLSAAPVLLKGMSGNRQSWPILSVNRIGQRKSVVCHAKLSWFCQPSELADFVIRVKTCSILDDKIGQLFCM